MLATCFFLVMRKQAMPCIVTTPYQPEVSPIENTKPYPDPYRASPWDFEFENFEFEDERHSWRPWDYETDEYHSWQPWGFEFEDYYYPEQYSFVNRHVTFDDKVEVYRYGDE